MRRYPKTARIGLAMALTCMAASAHELRPAYLDLLEVQPGEYAVLWKTPMRGDMQLSLTPEFSGDTTVTSEVTTRSRSGASFEEWTLRAPMLREQTVRIRGLEGTMTDAVVRIMFADGSEWRTLLTPRSTSAAIPENLAYAVPNSPSGDGPSNRIAAISAWAMMCIAAAMVQTRRGGQWRRAIVGIAYAVGVAAAFVLVRVIVEIIPVA